MSRRACFSPRRWGRTPKEKGKKNNLGLVSADFQIRLFLNHWRVRPYYREYTWTRPISEVKPGQAQLVLRWPHPFDLSLGASVHFLSVYFFRYILVPLRWTRRTWSSNFWRRQRHPFFHSSKYKRYYWFFSIEIFLMWYIKFTMSRRALFPLGRTKKQIGEKKGGGEGGFVQPKFSFSIYNDAYGHTTGKTPEPVRFQK